MRLTLRFIQLLDLQRPILENLVGADIDRSSACINDQRLLTRLRTCQKTAMGRDSTTDLEVFTRLGICSAEVETGFTLGNEVDASVLSRGVLDKARFDGRGSQLTLLWPLPSVGMGQHQFNCCDGVPFNIWLRRLEQHLGRVEEVAHEIGEYIDDSFPLWQFHTHLIHHRGGQV